MATRVAKSTRRPETRVTVTRAEIAALLGIAAVDLPVSVAVGDSLGIPQAWVPALLRKASIAMNPYAAARYGQ